MASSRSSLASDLHDVGTPAPSSPFPPPDSSTPLPPEDQDKKQRSRSPTPQPQVQSQPPPSSSQVQEESTETGAISTSTTAPISPPEISVQSAEDGTITGISNTTSEGTAAQQLSLSEAGEQVEASVRDEGEGIKEIKKEEEEEEDAFGDFQGAEGVMPAAAATTTLDSGSTQTEAPAGEQSQSTAGSASQTPSQMENAQEAGYPSSFDTNLTDTATNLQQTSPDTVTGTYGHVCSSS